MPVLNFKLILSNGIIIYICIYEYFKNLLCSLTQWYHHLCENSTLQKNQIEKKEEESERLIQKLSDNPYSILWRAKLKDVFLFNN